MYLGVGCRAWHDLAEGRELGRDTLPTNIGAVLDDLEKL